MNTSKKLYIEYINKSFDCEDMGISEDCTVNEKASRLCELIENRHTQDRRSNIKEHLQGLGQYIDIDYMNVDILDRAKDYGVIEGMLNNAKYSKYKNKELALERVEEQILENYWDVMANYINQLAK